MERTEVKRKTNASILTWVITIAIAGGLIFYFVWEQYQANEREKLIDRLADQYKREQLLK
jgi:hypothetical protein